MPPARVTITLAIGCTLVWALLALTGLTVEADVIGGFIPARISGLVQPGALPTMLTPLSSTLLHAGLIHLGFNMLMLVYCGIATERVIGPWGMAILYIVGAYAAAGAQYLAGPLDLSPMIGASGAISAIFGAYALLFGQAKGNFSNRRIALAINILWLAVAWIVLQLLMAVATTRGGMAVAVAAHIGGFLAGLLLARPLLLWRYRRA